MQVCRAWQHRAKPTNLRKKYFTAEDKQEAIRRNARKSVKKHSAKLKAETFSAYGGPVCACCGESDIRFLSLDHIHNNGADERRAMTGQNRVPSTNQYRALKKAGFPSGYQVLCMNCNWGKRMNGGVCPHQDRLNA